MPNSSPQHQVLIIEPNDKLIKPYSYLKNFSQIRARTVKQAVKALAANKFVFFIISASFSPEKQLLLLDAFKQNFKDQVIPLLVVVDLNQPTSTVLGTNWSNKIALLASNASRKLTLLTVESLTSA